MKDILISGVHAGILYLLGAEIAVAIYVVFLFFVTNWSSSSLITTLAEGQLNQNQKIKALEEKLEEYGSLMDDQQSRMEYLEQKKEVKNHEFY